MGAISFFKRLFFKKRKFERFCVKNGTFVYLSPTAQGAQWKVNLVDISLGGMAFVYEGNPDELTKTGFLKVFAETSQRNKLQYKTVSDIPAPGCETSQFRRRGIEFTWMGHLEKRDVLQFIKENATICKGDNL